MMEFSVITPTWNRLSVLEEFFPALLENTPWEDGELIVIEQGSEPETRAYVHHQSSKVPRYVIVENDRNVGIPRAWNLGLRIASGKLLICLGSDHEVQSGWIDELLYVLQFPSAGCAAIPSDALIDAGFVGEKTVGDNEIVVRPSLHNSNVGAMMAFLRGTFRKLGYFNEEYGLYGEEDADWGARIAVLGLLNLYSARMTCRSIATQETKDEREWKNSGMAERIRTRTKRVWEYTSGCRGVYLPWPGPPDAVAS